MADGTTFKYKQLDIETQAFSKKAIKRLIAKGDFKRDSTGMIYKPNKIDIEKLKSIAWILKP